VTPPVIELDGVARSFPGPPPVDALHPTDLTVEVGQFVAICGPSGSGKSTLLNLLGLLDSPTEGAYRFDGDDVGALDDRRRSGLRAHRFGFVFQSFHLLGHRTAAENVVLSLLYQRSPRRQRSARAAQALQRVGMADFADAHPAVLSGGERQRVAIARAIVGDPKVLLCDEPTGNLDSVSAHRVLDTLEALHANGITLLVITHNPTVAARAQRVVTIADGHLTETTSQ
jgi:putative ABC transport system ATP-binding protein